MTPPRHPYDPGEPFPDDALEGAGPLLVLLAAAGAPHPWSTRAAVALARGWAGEGRRVFLADLGLGAPTLHHELGTDGGEGMSDVFLYGGSLRRVARPTAHGFLFASAGTAVADPREVLGSPRWERLTQGFARAGAHLVAYLPMDEPGADAVLARADRVIVLSDGGDLPESLAGVAGRVARVLDPPAISEEVVPAAAIEALGAVPEPGAQPAAPPRVAATPVEAAPPRSEPRAQTKPGRPWSRAVLLALLLLAAGAFALDRYGRLPFGTAGLGTAGEDEAADAPAPVPPAADPPAVAAVADGGYFLTLGSYSEEAVVRIQAEALAGRRPDLLFLVSPVEVNGEIFHRLLAGEALDTAATGLRESLAATLTQEDPDAWLSRHAPLSFHLGDFPSHDEARAFAAELAEREVPAFVLHALRDSASAGVRDAPPGPGPFDVWAGAYADPLEAGHLGRILQARGLAPNLIRRTGELPPA